VGIYTRRKGSTPNPENDFRKLSRRLKRIFRPLNDEIAETDDLLGPAVRRFNPNGVGKRRPGERWSG